MIVPLGWDTEHFGFPVARIEPGHAVPAELDVDLDEARASGVRLAYHYRPANDPLDEAWLEARGGRALSARVLYAKPLDVGRRPVPEGVEIESVREVSDGLRAFVPQCGQWSRFRLDPDVPESAFVSLYEVWLDRSVAGEMAECVIAVGDARGRELGLVTVSRPDPKTGRIGLIGVRDDARGAGLGRALVAAAEAAMEALGAERAEVSTHLENVAACRLFESFGYRPGPAERAHHFWLEAAS